MIKELSKFNKREFEYTSPDGDKFLIVYVECDGKKYVQISKDSNDPYVEPIKVTWDLEMLFDINDRLREVTSRVRSATAPSSGHSLLRPTIIDHRDNQPDIQRSVEESMKRYDDGESPVQSFSPVTEQTAWASVQAGMDITQQSEAPDTPQEYKIDKENLAGWKKDVAVRQTFTRPDVATHGPEGKKFRRDTRKISAKDIL